MEFSKEKLIGMYETMLTIRAFESKAVDLFADNKLPGFVHLYLGEEAVATGVCANLADKDFITSTHRGHGHLLAKGGKVDLMMAELFGKATGYCKGKGGSMHIADVDLGILGANGIVGAGQPIAAGAAFACKYKKSDAVVVCFFGDGASNRGTLHESINMASIWQLPVVYVCENNLYGISNCQRNHMVVNDVADRAGAYGIPGVVVDGNDVMAVTEAAAEAIARARRGEGPSLIECKTWRWRGHFEGDPGTYKDSDEQAEWLQKDPIPRFARKLTELKYATQEELEQIKAKVDRQIEAAVEFANTSPDPSPEDALTDVYA
ncbi:thiamine pyrophosphate-dependent dehydrogenase E1 component subunit alpha [Sporomusa sphaeroides]|uniref:Acetoin:2,6-dichlorophenolindophenol oxidoreductase subunit alpha n=1 Tax=Sporomusa sphaeroides DSM 2875 TaxID=1337886 RepID=A0ABP2CGF6_9FIRM|nr:thiamine pyrophosphate-dependent dehydrogenase E1 component subunit alpha [Sporomusa sphaeroides]OLS55229.1 acetoin:2,6-dichlorophenolindophenol oxidoreductase subunit alpha [Sporomusa sphaeroides DSM 2875]CVK21505.1 Acetoin:2,6-dichlorophenolindophenol oxidoreductase subunit alpha [Sporomusa sphaeroides DSM 2875]HML32187.1 thiamine pyrophosphate-dependent dehydrogenase E1 component subunit alpha [Sporomusa sphaeroides]